MKLASSQDERLVQHLREVHSPADTTSFQVLDFASAFGSPLEALLYSRLFWPDFVEFRGIVIPSVIVESEQDRSRVEAALSGNLSRAFSVEVEQGPEEPPTQVFYQCKCGPEPTAKMETNSR